MNGNYKYIALLALFFSCSDSVQVSDTLSERPAIFPDYTDITIPANIAPLNFSLETPVEDARAVLSFSDQQIRVKAKDNQFVFPVSKWKKLLSSAAGNEVKVVVQVKDKGKWVEYAPVKWNVAAEPVDPYIAYRLIAIALVCRTEQFGSGTNRSSSNISQSGGKNNNILIIGQYHLSSPFWQVYCELKHVSELIRLIAFTGMAVRTHIGNFSIFQITFRMSGVPPLTDEASIRRNNDFLHILAYAEYPLHIFIRSGSSKDIESVISTVGGQFQYIALASHTIQLFTCLQFERHSMHIHLGRYQFSSIRN